MACCSDVGYVDDWSLVLLSTLVVSVSLSPLSLVFLFSPSFPHCHWWNSLLHHLLAPPFPHPRRLSSFANALCEYQRPQSWLEGVLEDLWAVNIQLMSTSSFHHCHLISFSYSKGGETEAQEGPRFTWVVVSGRATTIWVYWGIFLHFDFPCGWCGDGGVL